MSKSGRFDHPSPGLLMFMLVLIALALVEGLIIRDLEVRRGQAT